MSEHDAERGRGRVRMQLFPDANAPSRARRALRELPLGKRADDVVLLASELVTNAVVHGGLAPDEPIELQAECDGGRARVEVRDAGRGFTRSPRAGHGLRLVDAATDRWGVHHDGATRVWFELPTHG